MLDGIWYSIRNWTAGAGLAHTVSAQVRGAGNTVFSTVEHVVAASTVANVGPGQFMVVGKRGGTLTLAMNTAAGSVTYSVNAVGFFQDDNG